VAKQDRTADAVISAGAQRNAGISFEIALILAAIVSKCDQNNRES
jgi:hypothetical protein